MLSRALALDEAQKQKEALKTIGMWRKFLFLFTISLIAFAVFGLRSGGVLFIGGIVAAILGVLCFLLTCVVDLSIRNGHRNVEKILNSLKQS